mgnify:CR=1 FL=1
MGREELLMMQLLGGGGGWLQSGGWLQVVFLVFLFAIPIRWPERIRVVSLYRSAYLFFALSIIVPSVSSVLMTSLVMPGGMGGGSFGSDFSGMLILRLLNAAGPVLFGISVILVMKAIVPGFIPPPTSRSSASHDESPSTGVGRSFGDNAAESQSL